MTNIVQAFWIKLFSSLGTWKLHPFMQSESVDSFSGMLIYFDVSIKAITFFFPMEVIMLLSILNGCIFFILCFSLRISTFHSPRSCIKLSHFGKSYCCNISAYNIIDGARFLSSITRTKNSLQTSNAFSPNLVVDRSCLFLFSS